MKVKFSYQTLTTPPPFAFGYVMELSLKPDHVDVQFDLEYLNRDELTEEEILSEGFTTDDDFSWTGQLSKPWAEDLRNTIQDLDLSAASEDVDIWLHAELTDKETKSGLVADLEFWEYKLQELMQAIFETAKREYPFQVSVTQKTETQENRYTIKGSFEHRSASVNQKSISWEQLQKLMRWVFDIDENKKPAKKRNKNGLWIDINGSKSWYLIEKRNDEIISILSQR